MESLRKRFFDKYNIDAVELLEGVHLSQPSLINSKTVYLVDRIENYLDEKGFGSEVVNEQFLIDFIEALTEANVFLPTNEKVVFDLFQVDVPFKVYKTKNSKGVLEDFKPMVSNDVLRLEMNGVYVGDGELVGTDAHIMAILKTKEYQEYKGKIIYLEGFLKTKGKSITFIDEKYPNYEAVIPKKENQKIIKDVNIIPLLNYLTGVKALRKNIYNKLFHAVIKFDDTTIAFQNDYLYDAFEFISKQGYEVVDIGYEAPNRPITIYYPKGLILIMPIMLMGDETGSGTKTISLNDILDNYSSENQDFITKKTGKKINEKKGVVAEWEDTIATLQDLLNEEGVSESDREEWEMTIATLEELLKEQKMELGGLVMSYSSPQIVEGIGSFTSQFAKGGLVMSYSSPQIVEGIGSFTSQFDDGGEVGQKNSDLKLKDWIIFNNKDFYKILNISNGLVRLHSYLIEGGDVKLSDLQKMIQNKQVKKLEVNFEPTQDDLKFAESNGWERIGKGNNFFKKVKNANGFESYSYVRTNKNENSIEVANVYEYVTPMGENSTGSNRYYESFSTAFQIAEAQLQIFLNKMDNGGKVDEDNLSYAEASKRWNKKAGLPEEGFQGEAIKIVKENPELLMMLEDGGRIYNDDQLELMFDDGGEVKEERSFKDGYEALKRMGIFDDQPKKKTNREKIEEAKAKMNQKK